MPVKCKKIRGKWRIVNASSGRIETNRNGNPVDGNGHDTARDCGKQARAINANQEGRGSR